MMRDTRRREGRGVDISDAFWVASPVCEFLETRQLFATALLPLAPAAADANGSAAKYALVHQELHRPPTAIADFNGDGLDDVAEMTAHSGGGDGIGIDLWLNDGRGSLLLSGHTDCDDTDPNALVFAADITAGDVNGDGTADVITKLFSVTAEVQPVGREAKVTMHVLANDGKGALLHTAAHEAAHVVQQRGGVSLRAMLADEGKDSVSVADLDGDGVGDIVSVYGDELSVSMMARTSTAKQVTKVTVRGWDPKSVKEIVGRLADLDGDGRPDLVAVVNDGIEFSSFVFDDAGTPALGKVSKVEALTIKQGAAVVVGNLDDDGRADDLAVLDGAKSSLLINETDTKGVYRVIAVALPGTTAVEGEIQIGDVDGDGVDDLFTLRSINDAKKSILSIIR
jgi:hypothetical protein